MMQIGHGASTLLVEPGEPMGGYAARHSGVKGELEPLEVHAITFAQRGRRFALLVVDLVCVNTDLTAKVRDRLTALGVDWCWLSATHTHASPESGCVPGGMLTPAGIADRVVAAAVAAVAAALDDEAPATVAAARVNVVAVGGRRNNPTNSGEEIPVDALLVSGRDGPRGALVVTPIHPTVLGAGNTLTGADLNGGIRRAVGHGIGGWVVAATGAAGDVSTRYTRQARSLAEIDRLAGVVAGELVPALRMARPTEVASLVEPLNVQVFLAPKALTGWADPTPYLDTPMSEHEPRHRQVIYEGARMAVTYLAGRGDAPLPVTASVLRLGGLCLAAIPGELYLSLGENLRARLGATIVLGYTNGYVGYLPPEDAGLSYETMVSPVAPGAVEALLDAIVEAARRKDRPSGGRIEEGMS